METAIMKTNAILAIALFASAPAFAQTATAPAAKPQAGSSATATPVKQIAAAQPVDINTATVEQLAAVKGLTHTLAEAIVKGRPYRSADELVKNRILTEALFAQVKDGLTVKSGPAVKQN
jgi:competence protein ComEA